MDRFTDFAPSILGPYTSAFEITPGEDDLPAVTRGIYVGGKGTLVVVLADDAYPVPFSVIPGVTLRIRARRVTAASTASKLVGLV